MDTLDLQEQEISQRHQGRLQESNDGEQDQPAEVRLVRAEPGELDPAVRRHVRLHDRHQNDRADPQRQRGVERRHGGAVVFHRIDADPLKVHRGGQEIRNGPGVIVHDAAQCLPAAGSGNAPDFPDQIFQFRIGGPEFFPGRGEKPVQGSKISGSPGRQPGRSTCQLSEGAERTVRRIQRAIHGTKKRFHLPPPGFLIFRFHGTDRGPHAVHIPPEPGSPGGGASAGLGGGGCRILQLLPERILLSNGSLDSTLHPGNHPVGSRRPVRKRPVHGFQVGQERLVAGGDLAHIPAHRPQIVLAGSQIRVRLLQSSADFLIHSSIGLIHLRQHIADPGDCRVQRRRQSGAPGSGFPDGLPAFLNLLPAVLQESGGHIQQIRQGAGEGTHRLHRPRRRIQADFRLLQIFPELLHHTFCTGPGHRALQPVHDVQLHLQDGRQKVTADLPLHR